MPRWDDAATGLQVEYADLTAIGATPDAVRVSPTPFGGPQFAVTARGFIRGYARTEAELAALGVSAECIAEIREAASRAPAAEPATRCAPHSMTGPEHDGCLR